MKYISVDIETTGLDPEKHKILSIAVIVEDTEKKLSFKECPKFNVMIVQREIVGSPRAITMNQELISLMGDYIEGRGENARMVIEEKGFIITDEENVSKRLYTFLRLCGFEVNGGDTTHLVGVYDSKTKPLTINVAGKNFATFDKLFLNKLPWFQKLIHVRQRVLDPAILYCDWNNDVSLPSLKECKERANVDGIVTHNALDDAWDVIEVLRKFY